MVERRPRKIAGKRMPAKIKPLSGGRYDVREITRRVLRRMAERKVAPKEMYTHLGWDPSTWSIKTKMERSQFSITDFGRIADYLDAPSGWPFISDEQASQIERLSKAVERLESVGLVPPDGKHKP
jgi:hypothetical protein